MFLLQNFLNFVKASEWWLALPKFPILSEEEASFSFEVNLTNIKNLRRWNVTRRVAENSISTSNINLFPEFRDKLLKNGSSNNAL